MVSTLICLDCGATFEEPSRWVEKHGLDSPPYEELSGCPVCGGAYTEAKVCDICGKYIIETYVEVSDGQLICERCYIVKELGE